jgi:hypothetical protein
MSMSFGVHQFTPDISRVLGAPSSAFCVLFCLRKKVIVDLLTNYIKITYTYTRLNSLRIQTFAEMTKTYTLTVQNNTRGIMTTS